MNIEICSSIEELARIASGFIEKRIEKYLFSVKTRSVRSEDPMAEGALGEVSIILAGGNTPVPVYRKLADVLSKRTVRVINKIKWFFGDERWVEVSHPDSNEGMARENLLNTIGAPEENIFSWRVKDFKGSNPKDWGWNVVQCALEYEKRLNNFFVSRGKKADIVLLGMGDDGHTASLFPDGEFWFSQDKGNLRSIIKQRVNPGIDRWAVGVYRKHLDVWRLTLTPAFLNMAKLVVFLIDGANKRKAFKEIVDNIQSANKGLPASWIEGKETFYFVTSSVYE